MTPDDQITAQARVAGSARGARQLARRALWRLAPGYARRRGLPAVVQRLQADLDHVSKRHGEQIERLEELARELVSTAESLRREIARQAPRDAD
jgi:glucose-6-phosphate-specific signal transduction histidine kinase